LYIYCANECKHDIEYWDEREEYNFYYCECEAAKAELEYDKEYQILENKYSNILFPCEDKLNQLRFKQQIIEISYKFGGYFKNEYLDKIRKEL